MTEAQADHLNKMLALGRAWQESGAPARLFAQEHGVTTWTFTVVPEGAGEMSNVTIATELPVRRGVLGAIERFLATKALQPLYREELRRLAACVSAPLPWAGAAKGHSG